MLLKETFWLIIGGIVGLSIMFLLWIYLPAKLAKNRGRSALGWVLLSYYHPIFSLHFIADCG